MSKRIYIDSNIYLDYFQARTDSIKPLDEIAFQLFKRTISCEFEIVLSDWVLIEMKKYVTAEQIGFLTDELTQKNKLILVEMLDFEIKQAKLISKNWRDFVHVLIAKRTNCELIVTRNIIHFEEFNSLLQSELSENI